MYNQIDANLWTVDGPELVFAGAPMHTRMTVVRLQDGRLWVHSPVALSEDVAGFLDDLGGPIDVLVAPNKFHHLFMDQWRDRYPAASVFAEHDVARKVPSLANAEILGNQPPDAYADDIDQVIFRGNRLFQEAVFFHKASRSAIFTDLIINLKSEGIPLLPRLFLQFEGVTYPDGGVPRLYRWLSNDKDAARAALRILVEWDPQRILFCHGEPFDIGARELIAREFRWLGEDALG